VGTIAGVMQLADIVASEAAFWWFESTLRHHADVMQLADIAISKIVFWWFESTRRHNADVMQLADIAILEVAFLVVRVHSSAPCRCDAIGRHRRLKSSVLVVRVHSPAILIARLAAESCATEYLRNHCESTVRLLISC
jgi:hypothetical protein